MIVEFFCVVGGLGIGYLLSTSPESIKAKIRAEEAKTRANTALSMPCLLEILQSL